MACGATLKRHHEFDALLGSPGGCSPKRVCMSYEMFNNDDSNSELYQQSNNKAFIDAAHKFTNERFSGKIHQNNLHLSSSHFSPSPSSPSSNLKRTHTVSKQTVQINQAGEVDDDDDDDDDDEDEDVVVRTIKRNESNIGRTNINDSLKTSSQPTQSPSSSSTPSMPSSSIKTSDESNSNLVPEKSDVTNRTTTPITPVNLINLYKSVHKAATSDKNNDSKARMVSLKMIDYIRNAIVEEHETKVKEMFDKVLADKLSEQYESFVKFNYNQISRKFEGNENDVHFSYLS